MSSPEFKLSIPRLVAHHIELGMYNCWDGFFVVLVALTGTSVLYGNVGCCIEWSMLGGPVCLLHVYWKYVG